MKYPETVGSKLAAKGRAICNKLTDKEREILFCKAMIKLYQGQLERLKNGKNI